MIKKDNVIKVIEWLVSSDFTESMENDLANGKLKGNLKYAIEVLGKIYRLTHSAVKSHSCYRVHEDWRKEFLETEKQMKKY